MSNMDTPKFSNPCRRSRSTYETGGRLRTVSLIGMVVFIFIVFAVIRNC